MPNSYAFIFFLLRNKIPNITNPTPIILYVVNVSLKNIYPITNVNEITIG